MTTESEARALHADVLVEVALNAEALGIVRNTTALNDIAARVVAGSPSRGSDGRFYMPGGQDIPAFVAGLRGTDHSNHQFRSDAAQVAPASGVSPSKRERRKGLSGAAKLALANGDSPPSLTPRKPKA